MKKIKFIHENNQTLARVEDLTLYKDNPKFSDATDMKRLEKQAELGEHSPLLVTIYGEVLGGNSRLTFYRKTKREFAWVSVVEFVEREGKTHVIMNGKLAPRTFDTEGQAKLELALSHNDEIGKYDEEKLAELLHVHPIEMNLYRISTVVRPIEDIAFEAGPSANPEDRPEDESDVETNKVDSFMNGAIKQIVLYFDNEQYVDVIDRLDAVRDEDAKGQPENNTDLFLKMLGNYEDNKG